MNLCVKHYGTFLRHRLSRRKETVKSVENGEENNVENDEENNAGHTRSLFLLL